MPMFSLEPDEKHIIDSLYKENDRTTAIVAGSLLEDRLEAKLKTQLRCDDSKDTLKILVEMFRGLGPLSSFSAKIRLGYLLELYDYRVRVELTAIKDIRNYFAHENKPVTFESDDVILVAQKLTLIEYYIRPMSEITTDPSKATAGVMYIDQAVELSYGTPKKRFIATFGLHTMIFSPHLGADTARVLGDGPKS
jgi:DNA-binding MltR family transcriptional regulator